MNKSIFFIITALIILAGGYFLLKGGNQNPNSSAGQNSSQVTQTPDTVVVKNFAFGPQELIIKAGTTITWVNQDSAPHDVTSKVEGAFKSDTLSQGQSFSFTFDNPGEYDYLCSIHPSMTGKIIVQ